MMGKKINNISSIVMLAVFVMAFTATSHATEDDNAHVLETVTVTAPSKSAEDLQKTSASITHFAGEKLEEIGIESTHDLINFSTNIHSRHNAVHHLLTIRGVDSFYPSLYSPVGFYVDGVSYPLQFMHNPDLFDLESIEILKGPQGTLYGRNTASGLVNIVTPKPGANFEGTVVSQYGSYNTAKIGAAVRGAIVEDTVFLGVAAQKKVSDGFMENTATGSDRAASQDHDNARVTLRVTPSDRLDVSLTGDWMQTDDGYGTWRYLDGPLSTAPFEISQDEEQYSRQDGAQLSLQAGYEGEHFKVASITGYTDYAHDVVSDMDFTADDSNRLAGEATYDDYMYSQELRISSKEKDGALQWLVGVYGFKEQLDTYFAYNIVNAWGLTNTSLIQPDADIESQGYAGFGQATYELLDGLRLTAGIRYDHQEIKGKVTGMYIDMSTFSFQTYDLNDELSFGEWLPKASLAYEATDTVLLYTSVAKGYNTGGFIYTPTANFTGDGFAYHPEYSWNYEAGLKTNWFNNRLRANLVAFYIDMRDKQVSEYDQTTFQGITTNAGEAHSQGIELEIAARPLPGLDVFGGYGYNDAQFDKFTATEVVGSALARVDYSGNNLQFAPRHTYNLGMRYQHASGIFGRVDFLGRSAFYGDYANTAKADGYNTVNLRAGYIGENLDVVLWADNVFDEEYLTYITPRAPYTAGIDGKPFTLGVTVTSRF